MGRAFDKRLLVGAGLVAALLVVNAALAYRNTRQLAVGGGSVAHTHEVLDTTGDLMRVLVDAETGQRGFILTGNESFLEPYQQAEARFAAQLRTLKNRTQDNPRQQARIEELEPLIAERLALLKQGIDLRRRSVDEAQAFVATGQGKAKMDAIRQLIGAMEEEEHALLREREQHSALAYRIAVVTELIAGVLGLALVGFLVLLVRRSLAERALTAARLHEERERLRTTLTSIGDAVIVTDAQGRVTLMNGVAQALTGWKAEAIGRPLNEIFRIVHEQTRQPVESPVDKVIRAGVIVGLANHTALIAKDGSEIPIDDSGAPIRDARGEIAGVVLVFRDVTERRRLERLQRDLHGELERQVRQRTAELHDSEERFRLLIDGTRDYAIFLLDPNGHVASWNPGAERIKGYHADEIVGRHFSCFYPQETVEKGWPAHELSVAATQGRFEDEGWRLRKDGSRFWANVIITALHDEAGNLRGFSKITRDLSERRSAEQALRQLNADLERRVAQRTAALHREREMLRVTLASIGDAVITTDTAGRVTFLNAVAESLTGWSRAQAEGQPLEKVFPIVHEQTRQPVENPVAKVIREGVIVGLGNHTVLIARDGTEHAIDDSAAPIRDDMGETVGAVLIFRDVTEQRQAQASLRLIDRRKDEFLAMLAHELRNPLAPIRNALQIIKQADGDVAVVHRVRDMMERQVQHMTRMVDDLLDVSRITRGKIELRKEVVDLAAVVDRTVEATRPLIEERRQQLTVDVAPEPLRLEADPTRLEQILANLINNAAKYTDHEGRIALTARQQDDELVLRVTDTGVGIATDMLGQIFEPFVQSARVLHHSQGGLGIGLTLVRSLVEMHGGAITAHSAGLGKGSEFVVRLPTLSPLQPANGITPAAEGEKPAHAAVPRRIVVVDDNVDAADSLALLLRLEGHEVRVAHDGHAALEIIQAHVPDIVFLDIGMPVMNGYDVAKHLRQRPGLERVVLVAMTGWGQEADRRRSQEAGFDHHFVKPAEPAALRRLLAAPR